MGRADGAAQTAGDYFESGLYDPAAHKFYYWGELAVGECCVFKFSRNFQEVAVGPGTGTAAGGETVRMMIIAHNAPQFAKVEAFDY